MLFQILSCADDQALGRLDFATLSQSALMELVVSQYTEKEREGKRVVRAFSDTKGNPLELDDWEGVTLDGDDNVKKIKWLSESGFPRLSSEYEEYGSLDLQWLPQSIESLELTNKPLSPFDANHLPRSLVTLSYKKCAVSGSIETKHLPRKLVTLEIDWGQISGAIDCSQLPASLVVLRLVHLALCGAIDLSDLPKNLQIFDLRNNSLTGSIDLTSLPATLEALDVSRNALSGSISLASLPAAIKSIALNNNQLTGPVDLLVPACTEVWTQTQRASAHVVLHNNQLSGTVRYAGPPEAGFFATVHVADNCFTAIDWDSLDGIDTVNVRNNRLTGELDLAEVPRSVKDLDLSYNQLEGSVFFADMGRNMEKLNLRHNNFSGEIDLSYLPRSMLEDKKYSSRGINLMENDFSGEIQFGRNKDKIKKYLSV